MNLDSKAKRSVADRRFYTWVAVAATLIVFAGFARTYYLKELFGTRSLPLLLHVHGLVMTLWFVLLLVQVRPVAAHRPDLHRRLGVIAALLALFVVIVGATTIIVRAKPHFRPGHSLAGLAFQLSILLVFAVLVTAAILFRRRRDFHKRWMLLASVSILMPAIVRIPLPFIRANVLVGFGLIDLCVFPRTDFCGGTQTMKKSILVLVWLLSSFGDFAPGLQPQGGTTVKPPVAPVRPVTDDYYGTKIVDNYRYMEDLKDPEVQEWFKNQDVYTRATLASIPGREKLLTRIRELDTSAPAMVTDAQRLPGDRYFYQKLLPGESVPKLYIRQGLGGEERLLVDPGKVEVSPLTASRGRNALAFVDISQDGRYVAVGITPGGSENDTEIHVVDVATGHETGDVIFRAVHSDPQWLPDNQSFVYGRLQDLPPDAPKTELRQKHRAYLHALGRDAKKDPAVFGYGVVPAIDVDPKEWASVAASPGSKYVIGGVNYGNSPNSRYYIEPVEAVGTSNSAWRKLADLSDSVKDVAVHGDDLYLLTFKNTSRCKILRTDARHPDLLSAEAVVPPTDAIVETMSAAQDALYVQVLDGGIERILRVPYGPGPRVENVVLPLEGTAIPQGSDPRVPGIILRLESWTDAGNLYSYDPRTRQTTNTQLDQFGPYSRDDNSEAVNVKVRSYDGTLVPLSIRYPKGINLDGSHPTLLVGYGAYGAVTVHPAFAPDAVAWLERGGGIRADCGARGGGEYGEDWHLAGKGPTKPNTWRDFVACAEYLVDKKYTSPAHLAGDGRSAGGILIGRAITERPDLFGAAIIVSGVLDALRSETTAHGLGDIAEFGSTKTEDGFKALFAMSAYHHVKDRTAYPAVLITAGINDPRVDPWESAKMTARLQAATSSGKPVLLRVDYGGGHGVIGATLQQVQEARADSWSFLLWQLGDPDFQPKAAGKQ